MSTLLKQFHEEGIKIGKVEGKAEGKAEEGRKMVLTVLRARFLIVPPQIEYAVCEMSDLIALESLAAHAATCPSLEEFEKALR